MENSRLMAGWMQDLGSRLWNLAARAWWLSGLAMRRPPRRRRIKEQQLRTDLPGQRL
jgi:hypothetical protein